MSAVIITFPRRRAPLRYQLFTIKAHTSKSRGYSVEVSGSDLTSRPKVIWHGDSYQAARLATAALLQEAMKSGADCGVLDLVQQHQEAL